MKSPKIYIIVAAYNESGTIQTVVRSLIDIYTNVVVVDDGSTDGTSDIVVDYPISLLRHIFNRGQGAALQTGMQYALQSGADIVVTFDADGQHDVDDIQRLINPILNSESDLTLGSRFLGKSQHMPFSRFLLLKSGILFTRVFSGIKVTDVHNGLRAFSRKAAFALNIKMDRMGHASEILDQIYKAGLKFKEVPVNIYYTKYSIEKGQSTWNIIKIAAEILLGKVGAR